VTDPDLDRRWMERCRELALKARAAGNTGVGSLVAVADRVIAEAGEECPAGPDPFAHAELLAVRSALVEFGRPLPPAATLYTTAEPCILCSFAIREAGLRRVVIGARTPAIGGATSLYPILVANDVERWGAAPEVVWWGGLASPP
jgi:tRNA(adenine34) deaminase